MTVSLFLLLFNRQLKDVQQQDKPVVVAAVAAQQVRLLLEPVDLGFSMVLLYPEFFDNLLTNSFVFNIEITEFSGLIIFWQKLLYYCLAIKWSQT